jgi:hypothetical protein
MTHPDYAGLLDTLAGRDAFGTSLPDGTDMGAVHQAIARGCSASWIRSHADELTSQSPIPASLPLRNAARRRSDEWLRTG